LEPSLVSIARIAPEMDVADAPIVGPNDTGAGLHAVEEHRVRLDCGWRHLHVDECTRALNHQRHRPADLVPERCHRLERGVVCGDDLVTREHASLFGRRAVDHTNYDTVALVIGARENTDAGIRDAPAG